MKITYGIIDSDESDMLKNQQLENQLISLLVKACPLSEPGRNLKGFIRSGGFLVCAFHNGVHLVGVAVVIRLKRLMGLPSGLIEYLAVEDCFTRHGIGEELVLSTIAHLQKNSCVGERHTDIVLGSKYKGARRLCERLGFVHLDTLLLRHTSHIK